MIVFQKLRDGFARFMQGRHGADSFSRFLLWVWLGLYVLSLLPYCWILSYVGLAVAIYSIFRMFSRNNQRRWAENAKYVQISGKIRISFSQARARFKNRKEYKYFRCPNCRSWMKLRRGAGEGTLRCSKCQHSFQAKA